MLLGNKYRPSLPIFPCPLPCTGPVRRPLPVGSSRERRCALRRVVSQRPCALSEASCGPHLNQRQLKLSLHVNHQPAPSHVPWPCHARADQTGVRGESWKLVNHRPSPTVDPPWGGGGQTQRPAVLSRHLYPASPRPTVFSSDIPPSVSPPPLPPPLVLTAPARPPLHTCTPPPPHHLLLSTNLQILDPAAS